MANPIFRVKCKIDGEEHTIDVQTHGNRAHPHCPIVLTPEHAVAHVKKLAENHRIDNGDGTFRYVSHIDAGGDEHTITDIDPVAVVVTPAMYGRIQAAGTPEQIAEIAGAK
jgi:hypothetical protein